MDTYLGYFFSHAVGREEHWKQISLARVGSALSVSATLGLPPALGMCAFPLYTAQATGCSAANRVKRALGCMHFPGLSHSGSGSRLLHQGTHLVGPAFCALPRSKQLRRPGAWGAHSLQVGGASSHLPHHSRLVSSVSSGHAFSDVLCVPSRELLSGCDPPGGCQPSRIPGRLG